MGVRKWAGSGRERESLARMCPALGCPQQCGLPCADEAGAEGKKLPVKLRPWPVRLSSMCSSLVFPVSAAGWGALDPMPLRDCPQ